MDNLFSIGRGECEADLFSFNAGPRSCYGRYLDACGNESTVLANWILPLDAVLNQSHATKVGITLELELELQYGFRDGSVFESFVVNHCK